MPLSEHEQRILADIEARLRADDPRFADAVGTKRSRQQPPRGGLKWAVGGFLLGFMLLFVALQTTLLWGLVGFGLMLASAYHGLTVVKRIAEQTPADGGGSPGGLFQRYLDAARRREDDQR
ncbi:MAG TPA: DUF3040 domain-containing protein [Egibacteraceae bacterium]|nr:DUF3040 domain-containing protein [Egibacteraceae bacterium]